MREPSGATSSRGMRRLRIGVSARIQYGDAAKSGYLKKNIYYLEQSFARWLQSAGVLDAGPLLQEFLGAARRICSK